MKKFIFILLFAALGITAATAATFEKKNTATIRGIMAYKAVETSITDLKLVEVGTIKEFVKSNELKLENDTVFTLDNLRVPVYYEERAADYMTKAFKGKKIGIYSNPTQPQDGKLDSHSNELVHAITEDGVWLEKALVEQGFAMVSSTENNRDLVVPLYHAEVQARAGRRGLWSAPDFAVKNAETIKGTPESYVIFEDVINDIPYHGYFYFNFVDKKKKRVFALVTTRSAAAYIMQGDVGSLLHVRVRVRGWVEVQDGTPQMTLTHPEQVEFPEGRVPQQ
jgi:hypothetical protein